MAVQRRLTSVAIPVFILALLAVGWYNLRSIEDWLKLRNYTPPVAVAKLAAEDTMTTGAKHTFYVNHPDIVSDVSTFRQKCTTTEQTIVLGCYHPDQNGIFIYDVNDTRLDGVTEVTAAHEMLHGAYDRLSSSEKDQVDGWLNDYYSHDLHDQRIQNTIESYKKTEPNDVLNEMHSVFGTEVGSLTPQLENYYKRYFSNRAAVVAFSDGYEAEFTNRVDRINTYEQQLADLKQKITGEEASLSSQLAKIEADRKNLESLRSSNQIAAYNTQVAVFNAEVDAYNSGVNGLKSDIASYNDLVAAHNALAAELRSLYNSLDTSLSPQASN